jgi:gas vesicle protein
MRQSTYSSAASGGHSSLTFFMGIAVGVALGMLFAPSDGRHFRSQLSDRAQRLGRRTADTYNDAAAMMTDWVERGREATSAGREAFRRTRDRANGEMHVGA